MSIPIAENDGVCHVLRNGEGRYSLGPAAVEVPPGRQVALDPVGRQDRLAFIEGDWTDMRPHRLRLAMASPV